MIPGIIASSRYKPKTFNLTGSVDNTTTTITCTISGVIEFNQSFALSGNYYDGTSNVVFYTNVVITAGNTSATNTGVIPAGSGHYIVCINHNSGTNQFVVSSTYNLDTYNFSLTINNVC